MRLPSDHASSTVWSNFVQHVTCSPGGAGAGASFASTQRLVPLSDQWPSTWQTTTGLAVAGTMTLPLLHCHHVRGEVVCGVDATEQPQRVWMSHTAWQWAGQRERAHAKQRVSDSQRPS